MAKIDLPDTEEWLNDQIDRWHSGEVPAREAGNLHLALGWTAAAYKAWVERRTPPVQEWRECAAFRRNAEAFGELSNFYPKAIDLGGGLKARSGECLFQALKFDDPRLQAKLLAATPMQAKAIGMSAPMAYSAAVWDRRRIDAMRCCVYAKAQQHGEVIDGLIAHADGRPFVESSQRDDFWGAIPKGSVYVGANVLGQCWNEARALGVTKAASLPGQAAVKVLQDGFAEVRELVSRSAIGAQHRRGARR